MEKEAAEVNNEDNKLQHALEESARETLGQEEPEAQRLQKALDKIKENEKKEKNRTGVLFQYILKNIF